MKVSRLSTLLLGSSLLLSISAFAGTTVKKSLHLYENVTVQGKQLAPVTTSVNGVGRVPR
jgi:hypothetical protein